MTLSASSTNDPWKGTINPPLWVSNFVYPKECSACPYLQAAKKRRNGHYQIFGFSNSSHSVMIIPTRHIQHTTVGKIGGFRYVKKKRRLIPQPSVGYCHITLSAMHLWNRKHFDVVVFHEERTFFCKDLLDLYLEIHIKSSILMVRGKPPLASVIAAIQEISVDGRRRKPIRSNCWHQSSKPPLVRDLFEGKY